MRTSEIAKLANVHPNTVRLYEEWGFTSPVPRSSNRYRHYNLTHALQMKLARVAFKQEFIQNNLRKMATQIVQKSGQEQFAEALQKAQQYLNFLHSELEYTNKVVKIVDLLLRNASVPDLRTFSHKEVATLLNLSEETLRNWERNGLYSVKRTSQNRRVYVDSDVNKLLIIRTLRTAHFSISSIRNLMINAHQINSVDDIRDSLISPAFLNDFLHVTDALQVNLNKAITDVHTVIALLECYIKGDLSLLSLSSIN